VTPKNAHLELEVVRSTANLLNSGSISAAASLLLKQQDQVDVDSVMESLFHYSSASSISELKELVQIILE